LQDGESKKVFPSFAVLAEIQASEELFFALFVAAGCKPLRTQVYYFGFA